METTLNRLSATEIIDLVSKKQLSIAELAQDLIHIIKEKDSVTKAWEYFDENLFLRQAQELDQKRAQGNLGKMGGVPVAVKDVFNTKDYPTSMGSPIWTDFTPGNDARVVYSVLEQDAIMMGKTVTAEFAVHYLSADKTVNPHNPAHIPGTSSSGSAAAVASHMAPIALGTQTAGSIIRPSSYCGVYGFKPTFGTVPRTGTLKTTDTLDTIGGFANIIDDIKLLFDVIRVKGRDFPILEKKLQPFTYDGNSTIKVGYLIDGVKVFDQYHQYALAAFQDYLDQLGKKTQIALEKVVPSAEFNEIHQRHTVIYDKTLSYYFNIEFQDQGKVSLLSENISKAIEKGQKISSEQYLNAINRQTEIREKLEVELDKYDVIITLSTAGEAPLIGDTEIDDTCLTWTFLGMPSLSIPMFKGSNNLPFGLQVVSKRYNDYKLLEIAKKLL